MKPERIQGSKYTDERGSIIFNNAFDASMIKRIYYIENCDTQFIRAWQGHKIQQRWFQAVCGSFLIRLIHLDEWEQPSRNQKIIEFVLNTETGDVLHVPCGYISSIMALEENSKLLSASDYQLQEMEEEDEFKFPLDYFISI